MNHLWQHLSFIHMVQEFNYGFVKHIPHSLSSSLHWRLFYLLVLETVFYDKGNASSVYNRYGPV